MSEGPMASHSASPAAANQPVSQDDIARRTQLLSTEHWSLLATRSMSWNEAFSRTSMFLSTLSAATVALALAGPVMSFGSAFAIFALIVLSVTLFLGLATYVRLVQVNNEDLYWVAGMNRIRGAYTRLSPGIEAEFVTGYAIDTEGMARTFAAIDVTTQPSPLHALVTTPAVVAVISSAIAGILGALVAFQLGLGVEPAGLLGVAIFLGSTGLLLVYGMRQYKTYVDRVLRHWGIDASPPDRRSGG